MNKAELYGSAIISSTNNSTMPGMAARKAIRKNSSLVIKEPYLYVSTGLKYGSDAAHVGSGLPYWNFVMPKINQNKPKGSPDTQGRPQ